MLSLEKQMAATRKKMAKLSLGPDGRDVRPSLELWCWACVAGKEGAFKLDALTASAVMPWAYTAWSIGKLAGPEPNPTVIGKILRKLGCRVWRPDRCKLWLLPGRDHDAARLKGGAYWLRRSKHVERGGDPAWEPDPLYQKKNHALYHGPAAHVARLYRDMGADSGQARER